ncbi:MAG: hypothetical protein KF832_05560 [Caldilineaceae bacterium]|nr:hypothetical protein [Caldilineaceae bacterium]
MYKLFGSLFLVLIHFALAGVSTVAAGTLPTGNMSDPRWKTVSRPPTTVAPAADETITADLNDPFTLPLYQWVMIKDTAEPLRLQLTRVVSDSRCPATVDCAVAGQAEFALTLQTEDVGSAQLFTIGSYTSQDQNTVRYAGYVIELTAVQPPAPPPGQQLKPEAYRVTLIVQAADMAAPSPTALPTLRPTAQAEQKPANPFVLDQPFTVTVGKTADIQEADFQVTLRSLTEASGCLTATDCSLMLAEGTLVLQQGDQREVLTFNVSFSPEQPFTYDFAGYQVQLVHLQKEDASQQIATFVVTKPAAIVELPEPQWTARCPGFSRFDAAAILQEDVITEAVDNLVFGPFAPDTTAVQGLCGYVSTADREAQQREETIPYLASAVAADYAVVAAVIDGSEMAHLLQLAHLLAAAGDAMDAPALMRLASELAAGFYEPVIGDLTEVVAANPTFTVSPIEGIGDEGVWLWQQTDNGYFAFLIIRTEERFTVAMALLPPTAEELTVLDYSVLVVRRFIEAPISTTPVTPVATPTVPPHLPMDGCDLLTTSAAAAILGEAVHAPVALAGEPGTCLYVPQREQALSAAEATLSPPAQGIYTQHWAGPAVADQLLGVAENILDDNPSANETTFARFQASLAAGDVQGALQRLPPLADGAESWTVMEVDELGEGVIWIWFTEDGDVLSALLAVDDTGSLQAIIASLPPDRSPMEVREALLEAARGWAE